MFFFIIHTCVPYGCLFFLFDVLDFSCVLWLFCFFVGMGSCFWRFVLCVLCLFCVEFVVAFVVCVVFVVFAVFVC